MSICITVLAGLFLVPHCWQIIPYMDVCLLAAHNKVGKNIGVFAAQCMLSNLTIQQEATNTVQHKHVAGCIYLNIT